LISVIVFGEAYNLRRSSLCGRLIKWKDGYGI
jgi:hypothetical protein